MIDTLVSWTPRAVVDGSLSEALRSIVADFGVPTSLHLHGPVDAVDEPTATLIYFFIAECLTNVSRYAEATAARVIVSLDRRLHIEVTDNGRGGAVQNIGRGLKGLSDRVTVRGGAFGVDSPTGGPTRIWAEIPARKPWCPRRPRDPQQRR